MIDCASPYMVHREHVDALVHLAFYGPSNRRRDADVWHSGLVSWLGVDAAMRRRIPQYARTGSEDRTGAMLIAANLEGIEYAWSGLFDGGALRSAGEVYWDKPYAFRFVDPVPTALQGLKLIEGYEYQASSHLDWPGTEAQSFCEALRARLVRELDGYDTAEWGGFPDDAEGAGRYDP